MPWPIQIGLFDVLGNNIVMYWSVFGQANQEFLDQDTDEEEIIEEQIPNSNQVQQILDDTVEIQTNSDVIPIIPEPSYWVCLPGERFSRKVLYYQI